MPKSIPVYVGFVTIVCVFPMNSCVEILTSKVMVRRWGPLGGGWIIRDVSCFSVSVIKHVMKAT